MRLNELIGGAAVTADNARYFASPLPVVLHIVSVTIYSILGALQFAPRFRRRRPGWHRAAGRLLIPCGLLAAVTGMWMALFYPPTVNDSGVLVVMRVVVGTAMAGCILLGLAAVRRRDFARHQAWMVRGYALGMGAGTQLLTHLPWFVLYGTPDSFPRAVLMGAGWLINIVVAEWVLRRRRPQLRTRLVS
ncbi:membrane protein [Sphaerisporangium melleum]|uniref:Membrane protein n=2 Tax=Sphaerisporangium melleum TaxID=321316 RepID=A0A917VTD0_9ACTN|nr:membrane protein [Sphaerisporangium melleum]GII69643.1 membrane protein [Sphaerisporangium melleum]